MSELEQLRQEAEQLRNQIKVWVGFRVRVGFRFRVRADSADADVQLPKMIILKSSFLIH